MILGYLESSVEAVTFACRDPVSHCSEMRVTGEGETAGLNDLESAETAASSEVEFPVTRSPETVGLAVELNCKEEVFTAGTEVT